MTEPNQQSSLLGKIAAYTEIWAKDPGSTIFVSLAEAYRKMGMLEDAKEVVERGLAKNPDCSPAHIVLARTLCQQGFYAESAAAFQHALEFDPGSLAALVGYARLNILVGHEQHARELLLEARNLSPADSIINKLLLSLPEEAEAEPETEPETELENSQILEDEPADVNTAKPLPLSSITLAELYLNQGLEKEALEMYRQLSAQKPNDLMLRRQIRDLEERQAGTEPSAQPELQVSAQPLVQQTIVESPAEDAAHDKVELSSSETTAPVSAGPEFSAKDRILGTLELWLDTIQQRRRDV